MLHAVHAQDGRLRFRVRDAPGQHVARKLLERHGLQVEKFIIVELLLAEGQAAGRYIQITSSEYAAAG